ncbi:hypothetical protein JR316_0009406 [Psilocybe cubensis]|uniref:Uncharacterized protein n=2 Tax=Psilocybe cubensis TaxID=181762 RepID=A0ACB8GTH7_PSICU|nr:hypothetical protein JR316_0009406 [Psilocybe cubensis]KAH9478943.1 hypothetical protein JR316_0009406 [Psilocybe cubensis]
MRFNALYLPALVAIQSLITAASPLESGQGCAVLTPGQYTISLAETGWKLRPFHRSHSPPAITNLEEEPVGLSGVWSITPAPQSAYYITNAADNAPVLTLVFGGVLQPYTSWGESPVAFAIQCAGGGTYIIKNPVADEVWTAEPGAWVKIFGANGDISQRFVFTAV